jgi:hypothetical protein
MPSNYVFFFEDGKIDDYGSLSYKNSEFIFKLSNKDKIKVTEKGININGKLVTDSGVIYEKFKKWIEKTIKR